MSAIAVKNIAIVGAGYWGENLVRNFYELGVLKTICDGNEAVQNKMRRTYADVEVTGDFDDLLKDQALQGIVIATPAALHYKLTAQVLDAGKHVFVEKPLALTYRDGQTLVHMAGEKKKILFVGHILHYHPAVVRLKELINQGIIGRLQYIYSRRLSLGKIRREENILWSFAPHDISIILSLAGEEPSYIDCVGSNFLHARIPDVTLTNLKFPSGIGAHIFVSWLNPFKEQKLVIVGDRGMLVFDDTVPVEQKLVLYPHTINWQNNIPIPQKAECIPVDLTQIWKEPLRAECEAFLSSLNTGDTTITSGKEGLRVLQILEQSQQSLEQKEYYPQPELKTQNSKLKTDCFVHPTAITDDNVTIGKDTKIWHFSHVLSGSKIGEHCNIGQNVVIGPGVKIGNRCKIQNNVSIYQGVTLEDEVFCGPSSVFTNVYNPRAFIERKHEFRPTLLKRGSTLGANATIVCGVIIGRYAMIGAGAVIKTDVPDYAIVAGVPAKQIGWSCKCGTTLKFKDQHVHCNYCGNEYILENSGIIVVKELY